MSELIGRDIDKTPLIKQFTHHDIINITGAKCSGKSSLSKQYQDKYIVIDTDILTGELKPNRIYEQELLIYLNSIFPNIEEELKDKFDNIYNEIINYFIDEHKTVVIDSNYFIKIKDLKNIKGRLVILRTSRKTSLKRFLDKYVKEHPNATKEELKEYIKSNDFNELDKDSINEFINRIIKY